MLAHLRGELSLEECRRLWLHNTRAYAKRQRTWFRARSEARFFAPQDLDGLLAAAAGLLNRGGRTPALPSQPADDHGTMPGTAAVWSFFHARTEVLPRREQARPPEPPF